MRHKGFLRGPLRSRFDSRPRGCRSNYLRLRVLAAVMVRAGAAGRRAVAGQRFVHLHGSQFAVRARLDQHGWGRAGHCMAGAYRRVPCGLLAFAAFDPIPISTGGGPNEGMDAPPPAINLDTIAGCALLAMPRRQAPLRVRCECGARGDTCAWRPSSCADCVNLSVSFHAAVRSEARNAAGRLRVAATAFRPIAVCAM